MNAQQRMKLIHEVAIQADLFYDDAKRLGEVAANALTQRRRAQMTGLENIANSALTVSAVLDYVKTRAARLDEWRINNLDRDLLSFIEGDLKTRHRRPICNTMGFAENSPEAQQVYLLLIRAFVHQMVVHYEYEAIGG